MNQGSVLVFGGNSKDRKQKIQSIVESIDKNLLKIGHPDFLEITKEKDKNSIGIEVVRKLINFFITKPYSSKFKIAVVYNADLLTTQAQNALLKTLEEPPPYGEIILETKAETLLIDTVVSRCKKFEVRVNPSSQIFKYNINEVSKMDLDQKFTLAENLAKKERNELADILEGWISQERDVLLKEADENSYLNLNLLIKVRNDLSETNINARLALEYFLLNLK
ncbi:hypothetical protein A2V49_04305 [candidate division WWE3 bacterium RBG_19FT_COMBO_34_6]|uniref:DNA polymerase III subunit delta n=1 Tax=candidate division WWE3 bacterium RBG_19FT_COMBO_34_6 TaxID=1802612 RepID=A0A1F4UNA7_UNCKA|nr:MAG: hypothetical protein A2V49_04305 [candidate division WWE3 bacterium RBG_19FT_COMBO_34_6]